MRSEARAHFVRQPIAVANDGTDPIHAWAHAMRLNLRKRPEAWEFPVKSALGKESCAMLADGRRGAVPFPVPAAPGAIIKEFIS